MRSAVSTVLAAMLLVAAASSQTPIRVMILDGESAGPYHQWQLTTLVLRKQLDEAGLFQVDVVTAPPAGASFAAFKPEFTKYQVVVLNYDAPDDRWPARSCATTTYRYTRPFRRVRSSKRLPTPR